MEIDENKSGICRPGKKRLFNPIKTIEATYEIHNHNKEHSNG